MKMCEQILKKRQRPNTIQILGIVKNQEHRNIATLSLQLRSYKNMQKRQKIVGIAAKYLRAVKKTESDTEMR